MAESLALILTGNIPGFIGGLGEVAPVLSEIGRNPACCGIPQELLASPELSCTEHEFREDGTRVAGEAALLAGGIFSRLSNC
jgi:hypothetical protein